MSKKPKFAIVPLSEIAKSPGHRLDAGYYLGTNESRDLKKVLTYIRVHVPSTLRRLVRAVLAYIAMRYRVLRWKVSGRVRYQ